MALVVIDMNEVFTLQEATTKLNIGIATLFRWMKAGDITPLRIGNRTYIPKSEIERLNEKVKS